MDRAADVAVEWLFVVQMDRAAVAAVVDKGIANVEQDTALAAIPEPDPVAVEAASLDGFDVLVAGEAFESVVGTRFACKANKTLTMAWSLAFACC